MITPSYNIQTLQWTLHPYKCILNQEYIDSTSNEILKAFIYAETGETVSESLIEAFRSIHTSVG